MYTTVDELKKRVPAGSPKYCQNAFPDTHEAEWQTEMQSIINKESSYIDEALNTSADSSTSPLFAALPNTPAAIQKLCLYLSVVDVLTLHGGSFFNIDNKTIAHWRNKAEKLLSELKTGKTKVQTESKSATCSTALSVGLMQQGIEGL